MVDLDTAGGAMTEATREGLTTASSRVVFSSGRSSPERCHWLTDGAGVCTCKGGPVAVTPIVFCIYLNLIVFQWPCKAAWYSWWISEISSLKSLWSILKNIPPAGRNVTGPISIFWGGRGCSYMRFWLCQKQESTISFKQHLPSRSVYSDMWETLMTVLTLEISAVPEK